MSGRLGVWVASGTSCGSILQAGTCQILSLAESPRWSRVIELWGVHNLFQRKTKLSMASLLVIKCDIPTYSSLLFAQYAVVFLT